MERIARMSEELKGNEESARIQKMRNKTNKYHRMAQKKRRPRPRTRATRSECRFRKLGQDKGASPPFKLILKIRVRAEMTMEGEKRTLRDIAGCKSRWSGHGLGESLSPL